MIIKWTNSSVQVISDNLFERNYFYSILIVHSTILHQQYTNLICFAFNFVSVTKQLLIQSIVINKVKDVEVKCPLVWKWMKQFAN